MLFSESVQCSFLKITSKNAPHLFRQSAIRGNQRAKILSSELLQREGEKGVVRSPVARDGLETRAAPAAALVQHDHVLDTIRVHPDPAEGHDPEVLELRVSTEV